MSSRFDRHEVNFGRLANYRQLKRHSKNRIRHAVRPPPESPPADRLCVGEPLACWLLGRQAALVQKKIAKSAGPSFCAGSGADRGLPGIRLRESGAVVRETSERIASRKFEGEIFPCRDSARLFRQRAAHTMPTRKGPGGGQA